MDPIKKHLSDLPKKAAKAKKENIAFFKRLKKLKPKKLDEVLHQEHEEVFENTDCTQCANCCKTTGPLFTERDVERLAKHFKMRPAQFVTKYLHKDDDYDWVLNSLPCPFLAADNYCSVYSVRPKACKEYPHTDRKNQREILSLTQENSAACPAVFEMVERMKKNLELASKS